MITQYRKQNTTRDFLVVEGKIIDTICVGGVWVSNPTEDMLFFDGWRKVVKTPMPEAREGYGFSIRWEERENNIVQIWDYVAIEDNANIGV